MTYFSSAARHVRGMTSGKPAAHLLTTPLNAQLAASHQCSAWYMEAPEGAGADPHQHQAGPHPNIAMLRHVREHFHSIGNVNATLVLVRALLSLTPQDPEAVEIAADLELRLAERGGVGPEWSLQFDRWEVVAAHEFRFESDPKEEPKLALLLDFQHPCGDRHGSVVVRERDGHIHQIWFAEDPATTTVKMREQLGDALIELDPRHAVGLLDEAIAASAARDFAPIRYDEESIAYLAMLTSRVETLLGSGAAV